MSDNASTAPKGGQLSVALALFVYFLHDSGYVAADGDVSAACDAIAKASADDADALGQALVAVIDAKLESESAESVSGWLASQYGADHIATDFGADRDERTRNLRRYHFRSNLPWIAQVVDRFPSGGVGTHWVLVERVGETVTCADPYPWDDLDEQYESPLVDFMVKWELLGCPSVRFERGA